METVMKVEHSMTKQVFFLLPTDSMAEAYTFMQKLHIRHIPILDATEIVGMLSDRDLFRIGKWEGDDFVVPDVRIEDHMTKGVLTCRLQHTIEDVVDKMLEHKIDALPVLDDNDRMKGLVTSTDLLELLRFPETHSPKMQLPFTFELNNARNMSYFS
tara:strand:+ start:2387 stop:2857 length:471 start_codon:yes stop_codon:yes gene_type:complete